MSHRDPKLKSVRLNSSCLKLALNGMLREAVWTDVSLRNDCPWTPRLLAAGALVWAWADESTLVERWTSTRRLVTFLYAPVRPLAESYQAFLKLLVRWTSVLILCLQAAWREQMQRELSAHWSVAGYVMFGVDGSTSAEPALVELHWSLAGLWAMAFYALIQLQQAGWELKRLSIAHMLRAFRRIVRDYRHPVERGKRLPDRLQAALIDPYRRAHKNSRDDPRQKQERPAGPPQLVAASKTQIQRAQEIRHKLKKG